MGKTFNTTNPAVIYIYNMQNGEISGNIILIGSELYILILIFYKCPFL